jgi:hypothetical protein
MYGQLAIGFRQNTFIRRKALKLALVGLLQTTSVLVLSNLQKVNQDTVLSTMPTTIS